MVCLIVCILISAALIAFCLLLFVVDVVVVVVAALLVFDGLNFHLVLGLTLAYFSLFVLSLRRGLNKNMQVKSLFCSYLYDAYILEKTRLK